MAIEYMVLNVNNYNLENTITAMLIKVSFLNAKEKVETRDFIVIIKNVFAHVFCFINMIFLINLYQKEVITINMHI